jgi:hypothetical protein
VLLLFITFKIHIIVVGRICSGFYRIEGYENGGNILDKWGRSVWVKARGCLKSLDTLKILVPR